jgi:hypothetical protein
VGRGCADTRQIPLARKQRNPITGNTQGRFLNHVNVAVYLNGLLRYSSRPVGRPSSVKATYSHSG